MVVMRGPFGAVDRAVARRCGVVKVTSASPASWTSATVMTRMRLMALHDALVEALVAVCDRHGGEPIPPAPMVLADSRSIRSSR